MRGWVFDPHSGGSKIPPIVQMETKRRIEAYAAQHYAGKYIRLDIRFRGQFCYIDAYKEPSVSHNYSPPGFSHEEYLERLRNIPIHLCRLRYFKAQNQWSLAFFTYSHEKYEPCVFDSGKFLGTPEEGFATSALYLSD